MAELAENIEQPVDSVMSDEGGAWKEALAGDNKDVLDALGEYESPDKFIEEFNSLKTKDWRDEFAGEDEKFRERLNRFKSPTDFSNSYREAEQKIRSGEMNQQGFPTPPENATDADLKAFREQYGIPEEASGYLENLPEGLVIGDDDKPYVEAFAEKLHEANLDPRAAHVGIQWYNEFVEQEQTALVEADREHRQAMEDELRQEWGSDFRANMNLAGSIIKKTFGEEAAEALLNARDPNGQGIMNMKAVMEGFAGLARTVDPVAEIVSPGGDAKQTLNDEIAELEKYMATERTKYNNDLPAQERLRYLYDLRLKAKE